MKQRVSLNVVTLILGIACVVASIQCGLTVRDTIRVTAVSVATAVLDVDNAERDLYAAGAYDAAMHKKLGAVILHALEAAKVYVVAAQSWPEHFAMPSTVPQAMADALKALDAVKDALTGIKGTEKLLANVDRAKNFISGGDKR